MPTCATDTSKGDTSPSTEKKRGIRRKREEKAVQTRVQPFTASEKVTPFDVTVARRCFGFRPQRRVLPFLRVVRRMGLSVNGVLNDALVFYFDAYAEGKELRDDVRLAVLLKEERQLMQLNRVMLRSGAYLNGYASKVLTGVEDLDSSKMGRKPLAALAKDEEPVFRRMIARREAIVKEIRDILNRQLPKAEYVLKEKRLSPRRRRRKSKSIDKHRRVDATNQKR